MTAPKKVAWRNAYNVAFLTPDFLSGISSAVSSVVEHYLDTVGVTGSNPVSRTVILFISLYILPCLT